MTEEEAEKVKKNYRNWVGKNVIHLDPRQVVKLKSVETKHYPNGYGLDFELDPVFIALLKQGTPYEERRETKIVNLAYFEPNFILGE